MMGRAGDACLARSIIRAASLLVPLCQRREWSSEWLSELWHLAHAAPGAPAAKHGLLAFSLGSFHDACWLRRDSLRRPASLPVSRGSAGRCLMVLLLWTVAGFLLCLLLPGARKALLPAPYPAAGQLAVLSSNGFAGTQQPGLPLSAWRAWREDAAHLFSQIAWYRPAAKRIHLDSYPTSSLSVVFATADLPAVLGLDAAPQPDPAAATPRLLLSHSAWQRFYGGRSGLIGRTAVIAGEPAVIAGILPDDDWRLPGKLDALLLESEASLAALPSGSRGFVIARVREGAFPQPRSGWRAMIETRDESIHRYDCITLSYLLEEPVRVFLFAVLLALLAVPATTALQLGEYPRNRERLPSSRKLRRWSFLLLKLLLVPLLAGFWSVALAYGVAPLRLWTSVYIELATAFPALLFAFRWAVHDQRRRCPECLRLLSNPARVGQASCNFLSWNGTELICAVGHGMLHIPELPTSWFGTQRWLSLDSSWISLFRESGAAIGGLP